MTHYTNIKMRISEGQKEKSKKAFESNSKYITIRFKCSDLYGEDVISLTKSQVDRLVEAYEEKKGLKITMSKTQLARFRSWGFIRIGEHGSTKTNWKWVVSKEGKWCVSDRN